MSAALRRKIFGAFHVFVAWLAKRDLIRGVPAFPEIPLTTYEPTTITAKEQRRVLDAIPMSVAESS